MTGKTNQKVDALLGELFLFGAGDGMNQWRRVVRKYMASAVNEAGNAIYQLIVQRRAEGKPEPTAKECAHLIKECACALTREWAVAEIDPANGETPPKITHNRARCRKCGDTIESTHRHDYVQCQCGAIAADGGREYLKRTADSPGDFEELSEVDNG